jgi:hypothetical protein
MFPSHFHRNNEGKFVSNQAHIAFEVNDLDSNYLRVEY